MRELNFRNILDLNRIFQREGEFDEARKENILNNFWHSNLNPIPVKQLTAREQAQDITFQANEVSQVQGKALIKKALKLDPDCLSAYLYLANISKIDTQTNELFDKGLEIINRIYTPELFNDLEKRFIYSYELITRDLFLFAYANFLSDKERFKESLDICEFMLDFNPDATDTAVDFALFLSLKLEDFDRFTKFENMYKKKDTAPYLFTKALYHFKQKGYCKEGNESLSMGYEQNTRIINMLIDEEFQFRRVGEYEKRSLEEAIDYVNQTYFDWHETPGAVDWLEDMLNKFDELGNITNMLK